ncbi:MAG: hypothetical protein JJT81_18955 [Rubellimicrobium sp.]|jgi:hypothetical protein|nr:hypothetical protein [Rubellimicrobium sp.]
MRYVTTLALAGLVPAILAAPAVAEDVSFQLINQSGLTVVEMYAAPTGAGSWGNDILGANVLPSGETGTVTVAEGQTNCEQALLFIFEDGRTQEAMTDVCGSASFTIN